MEEATVHGMLTMFSPESLGLVCAAVYLLLLILFIPFAFSDVFVNFHEQSLRKPRQGLIVTEFPHHKVRKYALPVLCSH